MNWITILGIIIIAIGTLLTYYGSTISSKKDKKEITDKIDGFHQQIAQIKIENIPQFEKTEKIQKIESDFNSWAEQFMQDKEEKRIAIDKDEVRLMEREVQINKQWRELYVKFFSSLSQIVDAFNQVSGKGDVIITENPKLPLNIYDADPKNYKVIVQFKKNVYWIIWLKIKEPINKTTIPSIEIGVTDHIEYFITNYGNLSFSIDPESKEISVVTLDIFNKAGFKNLYILDSEFNQLIELLTKAFEYQIILSEK